jgi:G3E family GTPase
MFADRIIINKVDLVPAAAAAAVWRDLRAINARARILSCTRGRLRPGEITGFGAFSMERVSFGILQYCCGSM